MKSMIMKDLAKTVAGAIILAMTSQFLVSCDKSQLADQTVDGQKLELSVTVSGIQENSNGGVNDKKSSINNNSKSIVRSYGEFDVAVSVDNKIENRNNIRLASSSKLSSGNAAKAEAISQDVKFRLFLYKNDGTFVSSTELTANGTGKVGIEAGQNYKWYALSYNNTENVPDVPTGSSSIQLAPGKDVLHAAGSLSVPANPSGSVQLPILFKHKAARLAIELNSMGMFGNMDNAIVQVGGLSVKSGTIDIFTGQYSDLQPVTQTISWTDFKNVETGFDDRKVAYAYTVDSTTTNNVTVSISSLQLTHVDGNTRNFSATPVAFTPISVTPVIGNNHRLLFNLIESPLRLDQGGREVLWARSNLYQAAGERNPYRFYGTNSATSATDGRGYFAFGGAEARKFPAVPNGDPCALIYPQNTWRLPTNVEMATLTTGNGVLSQVLTDIVGLAIAAPAPNASGNGTYVQYPVASVNGGGTNPGFDAASNALRFNYNGQVTTLNVINTGQEAGLVSLNLTNSRGVETALWTGTGNIAIPLLGLTNNIGSWGYHARNKTAIVGGNFIGALGTAELLNNLTVLNIGVLSSSLKNVRCVRN